MSVVKDSSLSALDGGIGLDSSGTTVASFDTTVGIDSLSIKFAGVVPLAPATALSFRTPAQPVAQRLLGTLFTVEGYFQWAALPAATQTVFNYNTGLILQRLTSGAFTLTPATGAVQTTATGLVANNTLVHWAITRNAAKLLTLWINGVSVASVTDTSAYGSFTDFWFGSTSSGGAPATMYLSAVRITNNVCRYTAGFTPLGTTWPTTTAGDADWTNVIALIRGDARAVTGDDLLPSDVNLQLAPVFLDTFGFLAADDLVSPSIFDIQDGGGYRVYGTTKILGSPNVPVSRRVDLVEMRTRRTIRSMWSDPTTGAYSFDLIKYDPVAQVPQYVVTADDYTKTYREVIADNLTPRVDAMSMSLGVAHLQARLQASLDRLSTGGAAKVGIYDGTKPATPATAITTQVKLAEFVMDNPIGTIVGSATTSSLTLPADALALASGVASWARIISGGGTAEVDSDVSDTSGSEAIRLSSLTLTAGGSCKMTVALLG